MTLREARAQFDRWYLAHVLASSSTISEAARRGRPISTTSGVGDKPMNVLDPKDPNTPTRYAIDVRRTAIATMRRDWPYEPGEVARAPLHTGWYYECVEAGETASSWPVFPRAAGETLRDGSVLWQTRHPSEVSLPSIASVEWFIDPPGELAVQAEEISNGILYPLLTGGRDGQRYELTARVEWSPTGQVEDVTVIIPVAQR